MQMVNATGAEGIKVQDTVVFEHKEYEVTPTIANLCNCCTLKVMLMKTPNGHPLKVRQVAIIFICSMK